MLPLLTLSPSLTLALTLTCHPVTLSPSPSTRCHTVASSHCHTVTLSHCPDPVTLSCHPVTPRAHQVPGAAPSVPHLGPRRAAAARCAAPTRRPRLLRRRRHLHRAPSALRLTSHARRSASASLRIVARPTTARSKRRRRGRSGGAGRCATRPRSGATSATRIHLLRRRLQLPIQPARHV